ncbi:MAG: CYTH domain-containing protein [Eubacterium sp.]|nr:CYTH domain-containing protein [Eubacterium sp.]
MEIERKYIVKEIPAKLDLNSYESSEIEQGYLDIDPVVRIRRKGDRFFLTIKSDGLLVRNEFEKEISKEDYEELSPMIRSNIITKTRYKIPYGTYTIELDIFHKAFEGLIYAEVEFTSVEEAESFTAPDYFYLEVTEDVRYTNASLSMMPEEDISNLINII